MKYRFKVGRLIRDNSIDRCKANNIDVSFSIVEDDLLFYSNLLRKLVEEVNEVVMAKTKEELIYELSDVLLVLKEISRLKKISFDDVEKKQKEVFCDRGGFDKRYLCHHLDIPENYENIKKYFDENEKYPLLCEIE
jgi:predicted house-cleaning noncanonical NTP pyrophosphatase (MazG superfamily)